MKLMPKSWHILSEGTWSPCDGTHHMYVTSTKVMEHKVMEPRYEPTSGWCRSLTLTVSDTDTHCLILGTTDGKRREPTLALYSPACASSHFSWPSQHPIYLPPSLPLSSLLLSFSHFFFPFIYFLFLSFTGEFPMNGNFPWMGMEFPPCAKTHTMHWTSKTRWDSHPILEDFSVWLGCIRIQHVTEESQSRVLRVSQRKSPPGRQWNLPYMVYLSWVGPVGGIGHWQKRRGEGMVLVGLQALRSLCWV